VEILR